MKKREIVAIQTVFGYKSVRILAFYEFLALGPTVDEPAWTTYLTYDTKLQINNPNYDKTPVPHWRKHEKKKDTKLGYVVSVSVSV